MKQALTTFKKLKIGDMFTFPKGKYPFDIHEKTERLEYNLISSPCLVSLSEINPMFIRDELETVQKVETDGKP